MWDSLTLGESSCCREDLNEPHTAVMWDSRFPGSPSFGRKDLNNPMPLVGFLAATDLLLFRKDLNNPLTAVSGIFAFVQSQQLIVSNSLVSAFILFHFLPISS